jgi:hypothetical protein
MEKLNCDKKSLKKFGLTMGFVFTFIAYLIFLRHKGTSPLAPALIAVIFFTCVLFLPVILKPVYIGWMKLAFVLSWFNTRLLLILIFYLVFTPLGLAAKLFGVDFLDRRVEKDKPSYWRKREAAVFKKENYERQF